MALWMATLVQTGISQQQLNGIISNLAAISTPHVNDIGDSKNLLSHHLEVMIGMYQQLLDGLQQHLVHSRFF